MCECVLFVFVANNSKAFQYCIRSEEHCLRASDLTFSHKSFFGCAKANACSRHKFHNYIISRKRFSSLHKIFIYIYSIHKSLQIYSENPFDRLWCAFSGRFDFRTLVESVLLNFSFFLMEFTEQQHTIIRM